MAIPAAEEIISQTTRLRQFLRWLLTIVVCFGVLASLVSLNLRDPFRGSASLLLLSYAALLLVAWRHMERGRLQTAVAMVCCGLLVVGLGSVLLVPHLASVLALLPIVAIAVALPYLRQPVLARLMLACWATAMVIVAIGMVHSIPAIKAPQLASLFHSSGLAATITTILLLLWQFSSRLIEMLGQTRAVNAALQVAQADLAAQTEHLTVTLHSIGDGLLATDAAGLVTLINPSAEPLTGWRQGEALGHPLSTIFCLTDVASGAPVPDPIGRVLQDGVVSRSDGPVRLTGRDGTAHLIEYRITPMRGQAGEIRGVVVVFQDVTAHVAATEQLRVLEERYRYLVEHANDMIITYDTSGRFTFVNQRFCEVIGYTTDEAIGMPVLEIIHPDDRARIADNIRRRLSGEVFPAEHEFRVVTRSGQILDIHYSGSLIWNGGQRVGVQAIARDITERKQAERSQRLLAEAGQLLAGSLDYQTALQHVVCLALPDLGDACIIDLVDDNRQVCQLALAPGDPALAERILAMRRQYSLDLAGNHPVARVLRSRQSLLLADVDEEYAQSVGRDPIHQSLITALHLRSVLCVPLVARGRILGAISFVISQSPRHFGLRDLALVEALAQRVAIAIDNARLYQEAQQALQALSHSEARYRVIFESAHIGMAHADSDGRFTHANQALQALLGYTDDEFRGRTMTQLSYPADLERHKRLHGELVQGLREHYQVEQRYRRRDGSFVWVDLTVAALADSETNSRTSVAMIEDISARKALEARLAHQAFHDPLTSLPNRALLRDRLDHALARARRQSGQLAVLFLDLDNFKLINDSHGHEIGDRLLVAIAKRLQMAVRTSDTVARLGGDEFTVLLENLADPSEALQVAERILTATREPVVLDSQELVVACSIGIALSTSPDDQPHDLLRHADVALYQAKRLGRACYAIFEPSMRMLGDAA